LVHRDRRVSVVHPEQLDTLEIRDLREARAKLDSRALRDILEQQVHLELLEAQETKVRQDCLGCQVELVHRDSLEQQETEVLLVQLDPRVHKEMLAVVEIMEIKDNRVTPEIRVLPEVPVTQDRPANKVGQVIRDSRASREPQASPERLAARDSWDLLVQQVSLDRWAQLDCRVTLDRPEILVQLVREVLTGLQDCQEVPEVRERRDMWEQQD
jgi:hypothetical protein